MSAKLIKAGFKTLIEGSDFADDIKAIFTSYPSVRNIDNWPALIIWDIGMEQYPLAGNVISERIWKIGLHLAMQIQDATDPNDDGEAFDDLMDNIISLFQDSANKEITLTANTETTKILVSGEDMALEKPPPNWRESVLEYHAGLVVTVKENVNG